MRLQAFEQAGLTDVEGLGFGRRPNDGVEGFAIGQRVNAMRAACHFYQLVTRVGLQGIKIRKNLCRGCSMAFVTAMVGLVAVTDIRLLQTGKRRSSLYCTM